MYFVLLNCLFELFEPLLTRNSIFQISFFHFTYRNFLHTTSFYIQEVTVFHFLYRPRRTYVTTSVLFPGPNLFSLSLICGDLVQMM